MTDGAAQGWRMYSGKSGGRRLWVRNRVCGRRAVHLKKVVLEKWSPVGIMRPIVCPIRCGTDFRVSVAVSLSVVIIWEDSKP